MSDLTEVEALEIYKDLYLKLKKLPTIQDLKLKKITERRIRTLFGNLGTFSKKAKETYPKEFSSLIDEKFFTQKNLDEMKDELKKYKKFIITTAVNGCKIDKNFLSSIDNYCNKNKAALIILPSNDPAHNLDNSYAWNFPPEIAERFFIFDDIKLNANLFISTIRLGAKQIDPITGLGRLAQARGSFIYASPKQRLKYVAVGNTKLPHALMTTGALTVPNYKTDRFWSERTAYIAHSDHVLGAIVVELVDNTYFHFRQIQADKDGSFIDLGTQYHANGETSTCLPEAIVLGDLHSGEDTDSIAYNCFKQAIKDLKPNKIILHDVFSGSSINHHEVGKSVEEAKNPLTLDEEFKIVSKHLNDLQNLAKEIIISRSNHDEWLDKYLNSALYIHQKYNYKLSLELCLAMLDGHNPLQWALETKYDLKNPNKFIWLKRNEDYKIGLVQVGAHGDLGCNGAKGSLKQSEQSYNNCVVAHHHSAEILRNAYAVGTLTKLQLKYNKGASSWTQTSCLVYKNGQKQLINCINGAYKL